MKNQKFKWSFVVFLLVFAVLFLIKGLQLQALGTRVDGEGIGIYFLLFEVNDKVKAENIPLYAISFFGFSILTFVSALAFWAKKILVHEDGSLEDYN